MCGGSLETHVCSHIGHVFRQKAPYSHPGGGDVILKNSVRLAEVWMDDYKELFYERQPHARELDPGNLSGRIQLRRVFILMLTRCRSKPHNQLEHKIQFENPI